MPMLMCVYWKKEEWQIFSDDIKKQNNPQRYKDGEGEVPKNLAHKPS